jgi:hypothetical protein
MPVRTKCVHRATHLSPCRIQRNSKNSLGISILICGRSRKFKEHSKTPSLRLTVSVMFAATRELIIKFRLPSMSWLNGMWRMAVGFGRQLLAVWKPLWQLRKNYGSRQRSRFSFAWTVMSHNAEVIAALSGLLWLMGVIALAARFRQSKKFDPFVTRWLSNIRWVPESIAAEDEYKLSVGRSQPLE